MPSLIEPGEHERLLSRQTGATQQRMLRELAALLEALARDRVLVLWLEDLHWADRSTLEAIAFLAQRSEPARLLLLGTYRPTRLLAPDHPLTRMTHELQLHGSCHELALAPLGEAAVAEYLAARFAGIPVASDLMQHVHRRSEGNPLFMVTVADDLVARRLIVQRAGSWSLDETARRRQPDVPATLRELIEQQVARLEPEDRGFLEAASVAGIEVSAAAVAAALDDDLNGVEGRGARLARLSQFVESRGEADWPDGTTAACYRFVHALHQQVLYEGVPPARRRELHARIGERLHRAFGGRIREVATELAMHFERARDALRAVRFHGLAGENALARAAHAEAIAHLTRALELRRGLGEAAKARRSEMALQLALGPAWIVAKGYAAPEVEQTYARALELCRKLGDTPELVRALKGLWNVRLVRAQLGAARELAAELLTRARAARDPALLTQAHAKLGETQFHVGDLGAARAHLDKALALARRHRAPSRSRQDARVESYAGWTLWMTGYPDQARRRSAEALAEARALGHPHTRAFALGFAGFLHQFCGEVSRVAELAEEQWSVCIEHDIPYWHSWAAMLRGWVQGRQGRALTAVAAMREGLDAHRQTGAVVGVTHFLTVLAALHGQAGQIDDGLRVVDEALELARATRNGYYDPEIHRVHGDLLLRSRAAGAAAPQTSEDTDLQTAQLCFMTARELARRRSAKAFELRAATSLGRLWHERGAGDAARRELEPVYRWFTEGGDTADLEAARRLLAALSPSPRAASADLTRNPARPRSPR